jgi:hypothetical protein
VAPHVDLQVALVAVGARAHVTHVQVLLLHAMECKLLDRVAFVKLITNRGCQKSTNPVRRYIRLVSPHKVRCKPQR